MRIERPPKVIGCQRIGVKDKVLQTFFNARLCWSVRIDDFGFNLSHKRFHVINCMIFVKVGWFVNNNHNDANFIVWNANKGRGIVEANRQCDCQMIHRRPCMLKHAIQSMCINGPAIPYRVMLLEDGLGHECGIVGQCELRGKSVIIYA